MDNQITNFLHRIETMPYPMDAATHDDLTTLARSILASLAQPAGESVSPFSVIADKARKEARDGSYQAECACLLIAELADACERHAAQEQQP